MKLNKAFSEEIETSITAEEADQQYAKGAIQSKFLFQCPDDNCDAPVTCANLDKPEKKRKRDPYYKIVGEHRPVYTLAKDIHHQKKTSTTSADIYSHQDEYIEHAIRLNLQAPSSKKPVQNQAAETIDDAEGSARLGSDSVSGKRKTQRSKTLSSLIDAFLAKKPMMVQLPEIGVIDINDLFVEVNGQHLSELDDEFRIYFGKAWINKLNNNKGYNIVFANTIACDEFEAKPSAYIANALIESSTFKRLQKNQFNKQADKWPKTVFILSETGPYIKGPYINLWLDGLEYIDYR